MAVNVDDYIQIVIQNDIDKMNQLSDSMEKMCRSMTGEWQKLEATIKGSTMADNFSQIGKILIEQADASRASVTKLAGEMGSLSSATNGLDISKLQEYHKTLKNILGVTDTFKKVNGLLKTDMSKISSLLSEAVQYGRLGKNTFEGIADAFEYVSVEFNEFQKAAIGTVTAFAEFSVVKDSIYDIATGSDNAVLALGKIITAVGAAGVSFNTVFSFPAGLVATGITAAVAAVIGFTEAFNTKRIEEYGMVIKNVLSNPGGIPFSELVSGLITSFSEAAGGFDIISEKAVELNSVQKNIEDTWLEIYKIKEAMDIGVLSVTEGKQKLEDLFSQLSILTEQKFSAMSTALIAAYGEGGVLASTYERMGQTVDSTIDTIISFEYRNVEAAREIIQQLNGLDPMSEEYQKLMMDLYSLSSEMDNFTAATYDFTYEMNSLKGQVNVQELFNMDGSVNTELLYEYFGNVSTALKNYEDELDEAGKEVSRYWQTIINSSTATDEEREIAQRNLDFLPQAIDLMKSDARMQVVGFTDMLQNEFIAGTDEIIDGAVNNWENRDLWGHVWSSISGETEDIYVMGALEQHQKNANILSDAIEESFGQMGVDGIAWASEASKQIYSSLFSEDVALDATGNFQVSYILNENFREIINKATEGISELTAERGKQATDGYANAYLETETAEETTTSFIQKIMEVIAQAQDSHSPSKVTEGLGKDAADGYVLGFENNQGIATERVRLFANNILQEFSVLTGSFTQIGTQAMQGLINGISEKERALFIKTHGIANNIAETMRSALEIRSPSKVMFQLGDYTMQGFRDGMENLYQPILLSLKGFNSRLEIASLPDMSVFGDGYPNAMPVNGDYLHRKAYFMTGQIHIGVITRR